MAEEQKEATEDAAPEPAPKAAPASQAAPAPRKRGIGLGRRLVRSSLRVVLLAVGPLVIVAAGGVYYATSGRHVETENAYVKAEHILISPDIDGRIVKVFVQENQFVKGDEPLFQIDTWPYQLELEKVDAELAAVKFDVSAYRAAYRQAKAELEVAKRDAKYLQAEYKRRQKLAARSILPKAELDDFRHQWQMSRQQIGALQQKIAQTIANLGGEEDLAAEEHPRYKRLLAERNKALLDLERAVVRAPGQGVVSNVDMQIGEYVEEGKPVFSLMSTTGLWVEANLKETQLTHVRVGQNVKITVDAYPGHEWIAAVASMSPGTGAEFSLLPPQNATGNWVKVVQRVPVRIEIVPDPDGPVLRAGMSVTASIDTGYERPLPGVVASTLALVGYDHR